MLDFWESTGRVIGNEKGIYDQLVGTTELTVPNKEIIVQTAGGASHLEAWQIPTPKYDTLAQILRQHVYFQPLSMFGMGEWLRALPLLAAQPFPQQMRMPGPVITGRSPQFYAMLGAIAVDNLFAAEFVATSKVSSLMEQALTVADMADLKTIAIDNAFMTTAVQFCDRFWPPPCFVLLTPYNVPAQIHPDLTGTMTPIRRNLR
jgi:hypothetical protein